MKQTPENSREFLQLAIDAKIQSLRLDRNALAPVSSLPPEIFATIFFFLCLRGGDSGHNLARIYLSHVCHQWREIALNQSLFWSHVDFTTLTLAGIAEILARAKSAPLHLKARISGKRWDYPRSYKSQLELRVRILHICHLDISAENAHLRSTLSALKSHVPTLENLSLSNEDCQWGNVFIPDTLFSGCAPRLSSLKLRYCIISWRQPLWPLFKGPTYLKILKPYMKSNPKLADWLGALAEMRELQTLTLQWASPEAPSFPFDVERTVTLPSFTDLNIEALLKECVLALGHLDLPALTWLSLQAISMPLPKRGDVQELLLYVARYVCGTQHTRPLQSILIRNNQKCVDMLAWPVPDIGVEVNNPPTLLGATLAPRLALSFRSDDASYSASGYYSHLELLDALITGLPLDGIVMLAAQDLRCRTLDKSVLPSKQFWLHISPKFTQLLQ